MAWVNSHDMFFEPIVVWMTQRGPAADAVEVISPDDRHGYADAVIHAVIGPTEPNPTDQQVEEAIGSHVEARLPARPNFTKQAKLSLRD